MDLTDEEKQAAAMACRVAMIQAEKDRDGQVSPKVREMFQASVDSYRNLAAKFEAARSTASALGSPRIPPSTSRR